MTSTARNRFGNVGSGSNMTNIEQPRTSHTSSFGSGLGNGGNGWQGGIWGNPIGSGLKSGSFDNGRNQEDINSSTVAAEAITGSGSLLSSSQSDHGGGRPVAPWKSVDNTSPSVSSSHTNHSSTSPARRQSSNQLISQPFADANNSSSTYFSINPGTTINQGMASKQPRKSFLDPTTGSFIAPNGFDQGQVGQSSRHNSEEENRYSIKPLALGSSEVGFKVQSGRPSFQPNFSSYNSSAASRSGSLPPSRNGTEIASRFSEESVNATYSHLGPSSSSHRQNLSAHSANSARTGPYGSKVGGHSSPTQLGALSGEFNQMSLGKDQSPYFAQQKEPTNPNQNAFMHEYSHQYSANDPGDAWGLEENSYHSSQDMFAVDSPSGPFIPHSNQFRGPSFNAAYPHSPSNSDTRRSQQSPFYSTSETPPSGLQHRIPKIGNGFTNTPTGQAAALDRKLRGLQQIQQEQPYSSHPNPMSFRPPFAPPYEFHQQSALRMNPLAQYYPMPPIPNLLAPPAIPRGPACAAREHDVAQNVRSPLLEEFRNNSKTNKRYEIKDIYNNIVEFSGDQHGSRFIQQKLETANSDEKDQVFREIHPNSLQLMTDVFGNYVIQKFFEHGNQSQKKVLANQMKNHILALSLQMYGCRVVQKALEHILTDQQAQLVKELEHYVLKCVKDQNGNHVVQKAIERVPAEHIQFIINAFTGQVHGLATHPYGCRVIQRMLEHCEEPTRSAVLQELHACASTLIIDQYGNYVTQHVIEHGKEDDRAKVISLITGNLVNYSKHKFASNVVEKSIQFGTADQRQKIVDTLTVLNDKGESPLQSLIRDQYGNYVIQKLLTQLKESEFEQFVELIKPQLALLKRFSYGKQIAAIEKVVYNNPMTLLQLSNNSSLPLPISSAAPTPPLLAGDAQSPQSSSLPSTNASSINGIVDSRKSSTSNTMEIMTPTST